MNLPNWITTSRLLLTIPFLALLEVHGHEIAALVLFAIASVTDWVDGYLARKLNLITELGKLLDPLVDKVLVTGALVALTARGLIPAWSVTLFIAREFLITGLRALEAKAGVIVPAGWLGKIKTVLQMIAIGILLFTLDPAVAAWAHPFTVLGLVVYWVAVTMTVLSGVQYVWLARDLLRAPEATLTEAAQRPASRP